MKAIASFVLILSAVFSSVIPAIGQKSRNLRDQGGSARPEKGKKDLTRFESLESYSEGNGAYLRWRMAFEKDNVGFNVYRVGPSGSELATKRALPGGYFKDNDQPVSGEKL